MYFKERTGNENIIPKIRKNIVRVITAKRSPISFDDKRF